MNRRIDIKKVYGMYWIFTLLDFIAFVLSGTDGFSFFGLVIGDVEGLTKHSTNAIFIWFMWRMGVFKDN